MSSRDRSVATRSPSFDSDARSRSLSPDVSKHKRKRSSKSSESDSSSSRSDSRSPPPRSRKRRSSRSPSAENALQKIKDEKAAEKLAEKGVALRTALDKLAATKAGGAYIPPSRLKALMAEAAATDPGSVEYQRMNWDALKKSITGLVNKVAADNIKNIVPELFGGANLIRGRGLFCRSIMRAQGLSLAFTPVFASLTSIVNTKLPMVGELLLTRLVSQFRRSFKRNDKPTCNSSVMFIAHLVNQRVTHELVALEILVLLLEKPTDDSVEIAVGFMREVGAFLAEEAPKANNSVFDRFRAVLYEGQISKRVQYMIEVLSQVRRDGFKDNPRIPEALDLVEEEDQVTHRISLDDDLNVEEGLNVFKKDAEFLENEEKYRAIKAEILGQDQDSDDESGSGSSSGDDSDSEGSDDDNDDAAAAQAKVDIQDRTETNLINLRRTIYLTIMSSLDFEESVHKLLKIDIKEGQEIELCNMIIECCSQERTYSKFYGNMAERLCKLDRKWADSFEQCFRNYYDTIHRYETNRLRNIARLFGNIIVTDSISWGCFETVHMNEEDTTSSSRIFIKILFQELQQQLGLKEMVSRFNEASMQAYWQGLFPTDNAKNTRFSINYFTSIGMGVLTEGMREYLKNAPKLLLAQRQATMQAQGGDDSSDSDSDSSSDISSSSLSSSSLSDSTTSSRSYSSRGRDRRRGRSFSRSRSRSRSGSYSSRSRSYTPSSRSRSPRRRSYSRSVSPPDTRRNTRGRSYSRSYSPQRRAGNDDRSVSRSRSRSRTRSYDSRSRSRSRSYSPEPRRDRGKQNDRQRDSQRRSVSPSRSRRHPRSISPPPTGSKARSHSKSPSPTPLSRSTKRRYDSPSPSTPPPPTTSRRHYDSRSDDEDNDRRRKRR